MATPLVHQYTQIYGHFTEPMVKAYSIRVSLPLNAGVVHAAILDEGQKVDGTVVMDDETSFAKFRLDFEKNNATGLYLINVEVDVSDGRNGSKTTLRTREGLYVVANPTAK